MVEIKTGLSEILSKFEVSTCDDTPSTFKFRPRSFLLTPTEPIRLSFKKIE